MARSGSGFNEYGSETLVPVFRDRTLKSCYGRFFCFQVKEDHTSFSTRCFIGIPPPFPLTPKRKTFKFSTYLLLPVSHGQTVDEYKKSLYHYYCHHNDTYTWLLLPVSPMAPARQWMSTRRLSTTTIATLMPLILCFSCL